MSKSLLAQIDARAAKLGLTRSQYFAHIARNDIHEGGALVVRETPVTTVDQKAANDKAAADVVKTSYMKSKKVAKP